MRTVEEVLCRLHGKLTTGEDSKFTPNAIGKMDILNAKSELDRIYARKHFKAIKFMEFYSQGQYIVTINDIKRTLQIEE